LPELDEVVAKLTADDGNRELVARGEAIYQRGMPEENIAALSLAMARTQKALARFLGSQDLTTLTSNVGSNNGLKAIMERWDTPCRTLLNSCREIKLKNWLHI
jgi:hypothetical protein